MRFGGGGGWWATFASYFAVNWDVFLYLTSVQEIQMKRNVFANGSASSSRASQAHPVWGCYSRLALNIFKHEGSERGEREGLGAEEQEQAWDPGVLDPTPNLHLLTGGPAPGHRRVSVPLVFWPVLP